MQKIRRKWEFACPHLTQTATEILDRKLSLKKGILPGIYRKQEETDLGITYCIYLEKKLVVFYLKKEKKMEKGERAQSAQDCSQLRFSLCNFLLL